MGGRRQETALSERSMVEGYGAELGGAGRDGVYRTGGERSGAERIGAERSAADWSGGRRSGAERLCVERSGADRSGAEVRIVCVRNVAGEALRRERAGADKNRRENSKWEWYGEWTGIARSHGGVWIETKMVRERGGIGWGRSRYVRKGYERG